MTHTFFFACIQYITVHSGNSFQISGKVSRLGDSAGDKTIVSRDKMQKNAKTDQLIKSCPRGILSHINKETRIENPERKKSIIR